jgi:hypothetical protein
VGGGVFTLTTGETLTIGDTLGGMMNTGGAPWSPGNA